MAGLIKKAQGLQRFMLDCGFWRSRKWVGADLAAIGLQACGISYSYEHGTDGRLPKADLYLAFGLREKDVRNAVATLLKRGIWREEEGHYEIVGYVDHNPSQADVEEYRQRKTTAGLQGNHNRWHKEKFDPLCPFCESPADPSRNPNGIAGAIPNGSQPVRTTESQSRGEKAEENPPLSPFSHQGGSGPVGKGELERSTPEPPPPPPAAVDPAEHPRLAPLAEHLAEGLWPGRPRMLAETKLVVSQCLAVADPLVVDECIGTMLAVDDPPRSPKYLLATVKNRLVSMGAYTPNDTALEPLGAA